MNTDDLSERWEAGEECERHRLLWCRQCRPIDEVPASISPMIANAKVYVSPGTGTRFHSGTCGMGRALMTVREALELGYAECSSCFGSRGFAIREKSPLTDPVYVEWLEMRFERTHQDGLAKMKSRRQRSVFGGVKRKRRRPRSDLKVSTAARPTVEKKAKAEGSLPGAQEGSPAKTDAERKSAPKKTSRSRGTTTEPERAIDKASAQRRDRSSGGKTQSAKQIASRLSKLAELRRLGVITKAEHDRRRSEILGEI